jgi:hypothetical protein
MNNTEQQTKVQKITSHDTANEFYFWLKDHTEFTKLNSYVLDRSDSGAVFTLLYDGGKGRHNFDIDFMWKERAMLNDWIETFCNGRAN